MTGRIRTLVTGAAVVVPLLITPAAAAETAGGAVLVSLDGSEWSTDVPAPLFDPGVRWVPGDARTASFFVENRGSTPADVRLQVSADDHDALLASGDVSLRARVTGGPWSPVASEVGPPLDAIAIGVGESRRIDVRAALRAASTNLSQTAAVSLRFVVRLTEIAPVVPSIPATGAPDVRVPLFLAALCVGTGLALVRRQAGQRRG